MLFSPEKSRASRLNEIFVIKPRGNNICQIRRNLNLKGRVSSVLIWVRGSMGKGHYFNKQKRRNYQGHGGGFVKCLAIYNVNTQFQYYTFLQMSVDMLPFPF